MYFLGWFVCVESCVIVLCGFSLCLQCGVFVWWVWRVLWWCVGVFAVRLFAAFLYVFWGGSFYVFFGS